MRSIAHDGQASARALRADAIHVWRLPHDRAAGRSRLLQLLGAYVDTQPEALKLHAGPHGRPSLAPPHDHLHFNWSHSGCVALVAVARELPRLGIDVEISRPRPRALALARRYFSAAEFRQLDRIPQAQQLHCFLQLWTAKEAVLKAHGRGISYGLHRIEFACADNGARPRRFEGAVGPAHSWHTYMPDVGTDVIAHLAWHGRQRRIHCFWPQEPESEV